MSNFTPPHLQDPLLVFDAQDLRDKIIERLNQSKVFTDQNYQGSNLSSLIDIISYSFSTLLYYLNKTSSESMFSESQIYENMNRIVKILDYNPVGRLSLSVPFGINASEELPIDTYIIPRYSYLKTGGNVFSLTKDLAFSKTISLEQIVSEMDNSSLLKEGIIEEYPIYTGLGIDNEVLYIGLNDSVQIDHFAIDVYVKTINGAWEQWTRVENSNLYGANDRVYEVRFNSNKRYEIIFGDNINGTKLSIGDQVAVYYLKINPEAVPIGPGALDAANVIPFNSVQFTEILKTTKTSFGSVLPQYDFNKIKFFNTYPSSNYTPEENTDDIRKNAPKIFRSQHRLVTTSDYEYFTKSNFKNLLVSSRIVNNDDFLKGHMRYLYEIGLKNPHLENQILLNQVKFATSCNFNNVYVYMVPQHNILYLPSHSKEYIINEINKYKTVTAQIVPMDPEYLYFDFYVPNSESKPDVYSIKNNKLYIIKAYNSRRSNSAIKFDIQNAILYAFDKSNVSLGTNINTQQLTTTLLGIDGVGGIQTYNTKSKTFVNELSFLVWNSKYPLNDAQVFTQTVQMDYFMYPLLNNPSSLLDRIEIIDGSNSIKVAEF
jgi:hypothetical protein